MFTMKKPSDNLRLLHFPWIKKREAPLPELPVYYLSTMPLVGGLTASSLTGGILYAASGNSRKGQHTTA